MKRIALSLLLCCMALPLHAQSAAPSFNCKDARTGAYHLTFKDGLLNVTYVNGKEEYTESYCGASASLQGTYLFTTRDAARDLRDADASAN